MKKFLIIMLIAVVTGVFANNYIDNSRKNIMDDLTLANVEALAGGEMSGGTCWGAGPNFTNVYCPGGSIICCWAHTSVYGEN